MNQKIIKLTEQNVSGEYTTLYIDGSKYTGNINEHNMREGKGEIKWPDKSVYVGQWAKNLMEGRGKKTYTDGSVYEGAWVNGK